MSKEEGDGEGEGEGEGVRVRKSSRPPTADRGSLRWEEVGGGEGEGEGREQKEEGKMRRPSLVSTEGAGPVVRQLSPCQRSHPHNTITAFYIST